MALQLTTKLQEQQEQQKPMPTHTQTTQSIHLTQMTLKKESQTSTSQTNVQQTLLWLLHQILVPQTHL
jgi:hypothetical protein